MGGSLPWETPVIEVPGVMEILVNARDANDLNGGNENEENQEEVVGQDQQDIQLVYEHCAFIRLISSNLPLDIRSTTDVILRLLDTTTDFLSDLSRIQDEADDIRDEQGNSLNIIRHHVINFNQANKDKLDCSTGNRSTEILEAASKLIEKFTQKILPRFKQIQSMCNYHTQSIEKLKMIVSKGEMEPGTVSPPILNFLFGYAHPTLKEIVPENQMKMLLLIEFFLLYFPPCSRLEAELTSIADEI